MLLLKLWHCVGHTERGLIKSETCASSGCQHLEKWIPHTLAPIATIIVWGKRGGDECSETGPCQARGGGKCTQTNFWHSSKRTRYHTKMRATTRVLVLHFFHHIALRSLLLSFLNWNARLFSDSVLPTSWSIFSPRLKAFSVQCPPTWEKEDNETMSIVATTTK